MDTQKILSEFYKRYDLAMNAKEFYQNALDKLKSSALECQSVCREFTERLAREQPELLAQMEEAYRNGERIKDAMQRGKRWPEYDPEKGSTYLAILSAVPADQRTLEMEQCQQEWQRFEDCRLQI